MQKKNAGIVVLLLAVIGAAVWYFWQQSTSATKFDLNPYRALGYGVAEETAKLLGKKGRVVALTHDTSELKNPAIDGQLSSLEEALKKHGLTVAPTLRFTLTPMERMATGGGAPRELFIKALQSQPRPDAIVLLCAFPALADADFETLKQSGVKVVVASGYLPSYRKLVEAEILHRAVVPRFDRSETPAAKPADLRGWFEQDYLVITPANTGTLPY